MNTVKTFTPENITEEVKKDMVELSNRHGFNFEEHLCTHDGSKHIIFVYVAPTMGSGGENTMGGNMFSMNNETPTPQKDSGFLFVKMFPTEVIMYGIVGNGTVAEALIKKIRDIFLLLHLPMVLNVDLENPNYEEVVRAFAQNGFTDPKGVILEAISNDKTALQMTHCTETPNVDETVYLCKAVKSVASIEFLKRVEPLIMKHLQK